MPQGTWLNLVLWILFMQILNCDPIAPNYYPQYHQIQISNCLNNSVVCPPGFNGGQITSQVYYYYPDVNNPNSAKAIAQDTYDLLSSNQLKYSMDYTFIYQYPKNTNYLQTKIYYISPNGTYQNKMQCFYTLIPNEKLPTINWLQLNGKYVGNMTWASIPCYSWYIDNGIPSLSQYQYTAINPNIQAFIGGESGDKSQNAYYLFYENVSIPSNSNVFSEPDIQCILKQTSNINEYERFLINKALFRFHIDHQFQ